MKHRRMNGAGMRERDAAIVAALRAGERGCEIAARFGVTRRVVYRASSVAFAKNQPTQRPECREDMTGAEADAYLDRAVALECAPPWIRHPQPTT